MHKCETAGCPWCEQDSGVVLGFDTLGDETLTCKTCGKPVEVDMEESWDSVHFWLAKQERNAP